MIRPAAVSGTVAIAVLAGCGSGTADIDTVAPLAGGVTGPSATRGRALFAANWVRFATPQVASRERQQ